jgi:hypothetical protein
MLHSTHESEEAPIPESAERRPGHIVLRRF